MAIVYAAFDSQEAVASALQNLKSCGFATSDIETHRDPDFRPSSEGQPSPGLLSAFGDLFSKLGKSRSETPPWLHAAALRRGGLVIGVNARTGVEEAAARTLMQRAGSVDGALEAERDAASRPSAAEEPATPRADASEAAHVGGLPIRRPQPGDADDGASSADFASFAEGVFEIRETAERVVVKKTAWVVEELRVSKSIAVYEELITDRLQGTAVDVETMPAS